MFTEDLRILEVDAPCMGGYHGVSKLCRDKGDQAVLVSHCWDREIGWRLKKPQTQEQILTQPRQRESINKRTWGKAGNTLPV